MDKSERHELSVETAWNAMLDLENRYSCLMCWDIYTTQELPHLKDQKGTNLAEARLAEMYREISDSYSLDSSIVELADDSVERVRSFLGEVLYDIFATHRAVVAGSAFALHRVVCEQSDEHWSEVTLVRNALDGIVDLKGRPYIVDVELKLKRLFCAVYAGVQAHTPNEKPKTLGFLAH